MSNKLSRNWTTGYTSPFCTLWGSCNLGLSLRRTQNFEESLTQFHTSQAWACWPLKGIGKDQSGPPGLWGRCWHPTDSPGLWSSPAALQNILPHWVSQSKFLLLETPQLEHRALSETPNLPGPDTASPLESQDYFSSFSHLFSTLSGLLSKEKLLPPKPQSFTSPGSPFS